MQIALWLWWSTASARRGPSRYGHRRSLATQIGFLKADSQMHGARRSRLYSGRFACASMNRRMIAARESSFPSSGWYTASTAVFPALFRNDGSAPAARSARAASGWRQQLLSDATSISFGSCALCGSPPSVSLVR